MKSVLMKSAMLSLAVFVFSAASAEATLLLSLDARQPGASPATQWEDLTGNNLPFTLHNGAFLNSGWGTGTQPAFQLYSKSWIEGNVADEGNFDFSLSDAFTVVTRSNHSSSGSNHLGVTKGDMTSAHWGAGGGLANEVAAIDIGANNSSNRNYVRAYHPNNNPQPIPADATGMATHVFHFDGTGFGQIYIDGAATTDNIFSNTGGSPLNNAALRLGIPVGPGPGAPNYNGRLQVVEIYAGSTISNEHVSGMSPADYAVWRAANTGTIVTGIPEPTALCLLSLGGLSLLGRRRK